MPAPLRPKPNAGSVIQPQLAPLGRSLGILEPLLTPDAFYPLVVHPPPVLFEQGGDPSMAVPSVFRRQADDALGRLFFRFGGLRSVALAGARLIERLAGTAFRNGEGPRQVLHRAPWSWRAGQFPEIVSRIMALSRERSTTCLFR